MKKIIRVLTLLVIFLTFTVIGCQKQEKYPFFKTHGDLISVITIGADYNDFLKDRVVLCADFKEFNEKTDVDFKYIVLNSIADFKNNEDAINSALKIGKTSLILLSNISEDFVTLGKGINPSRPISVPTEAFDYITYEVDDYNIYNGTFAQLIGTTTVEGKKSKDGKGAIVLQSIQSHITRMDKRYK